MNFFLDSALLGLEYALLAVGVYITFRILNLPDLTVDGSFTFGMVVSTVLCAAAHPFAGLLAGALAGAVAGLVTGFLQTHCKIHPILAGILTMSGLYTVNITVLGGPNVSLLDAPKFFEVLGGKRRHVGLVTVVGVVLVHAVLPDGSAACASVRRLERGHGARLLPQHDGSPLGGACAGECAGRALGRDPRPVSGIW